MGYILMAGGSSTGISDECTAERKHVLIKHSAVTSDSEDDVVDGTMPNNGVQNGTLQCGESYTIPQGYTDGGVVTAVDLASQTEATAEKTDVRVGKTYWKDGIKNTGSLADKGAWSSSGLAAGASVTIPAGIHDGTGTVTAKSLADQTQGTLDAAKMVSGVKGYSNGELVSGSMVDRGAYGTGDKFGEGDSYYAICNIPDGWYHEMSGMESWSPEARLPKDKVREFLGVDAAKILAGHSIAGIAGNQHAYGYAYGDVTSGSSVSFVDGASFYMCEFNLPFEPMVGYVIHYHSNRLRDITVFAPHNRGAKFARMMNFNQAQLGGLYSAGWAQDDNGAHCGKGTCKIPVAYAGSTYQYFFAGYY